MVEYLSDLIGYSKGRTLSKIILIVSAVAISTISMSGFFKNLLDFDMGLQIRNWIALSFILVAWMIKDEKIVPPVIKILDSKFANIVVYWAILALIAVSISSLSFPFISQLLNYKILDFPLLAIRNAVAVGMLIAVRVINVQG